MSIIHRRRTRPRYTHGREASLESHGLAPSLRDENGVQYGVAGGWP
jgi:hypothetical protein